MRMWVRSLASLSGLSIQRAVSCGIGLRYDSDLALLWLWRRLAAVAPIRPLAWELPCAVGVALKKQNKQTSEILLRTIVTLFTCEIFIFIYSFIYLLFRAAPAPHENSQARSQIVAIVAGLTTATKLRLRPALQLMAMSDP